MRQKEGRHIEPLKGKLITISTQLGELERKAKYGDDPIARRKAAERIIQRRDGFKRTLEGSKARSETREAFDMFKFAVERLASADDRDIRAMAMAATGRDVIALKMISRANPYSEVGRQAREELRAMERPDTHDENGLGGPPTRGNRKRSV